MKTIITAIVLATVATSASAINFSLNMFTTYNYYLSSHDNFSSFDASENCHFDKPWDEDADDYARELRNAKIDFNNCAQEAYNDYINKANNEIDDIIDNAKDGSTYTSSDIMDAKGSVCEVPNFNDMYGSFSWTPDSWYSPAQWEVDDYNEAVNAYNYNILPGYRACTSSWTDEANDAINHIKNKKSQAFSELEYVWKK